MREELMFAVNIDEERERYAKTSEVKIIRYDDTPIFTKEQLKSMGFLPTLPKQINKYRGIKTKAKSSGGAKPVTIKNQKYPSMTIASAETGIPIYMISKYAKGLIDEKELLLRNAKRLQREESNKAYRDSEGKIESLREN